MSQQAIDRLQEQIKTGIHATESALSDIVTKLQQHDQINKASETASAYLASAIEKTKSAVDELKASAEKLRSSETAQAPVKLVQDSLANVQSAFTTVKEQAATYDEKYGVSTTISNSITGVNDGIQQTRESITQSVEGVVSAAKSHANDAIAAATEQSTRVQEALVTRAHGAEKNAWSMAGGVVKQVEAYDQYYNVSQTVQQYAKVAAEKARQLDEQYGVSKKALEIDERVTGGMGAQAVVKGNEMLNTGAGFVNEQITAAKQAAEVEAPPAPVATEKASDAAQN